MVTNTTSGITASMKPVMPGLSSSIAAITNSSISRSPKIINSPDANSSLSASTSVVTRVTSRPTGLRS